MEKRKAEMGRGGMIEASGWWMLLRITDPRSGGWVFSAVPSGRGLFGGQNQPLRSWLLSGVAPRLWIQDFLVFGNGEGLMRKWKAETVSD
jgi:hypothetical protein